MRDIGTSSFLGDPAAAAQNYDMVDRRELALVAVSRTRMPMVVSDPRQPDNPIVLANQAFLDLTGYTAEEVIGHNCRFLQGPETAAQDIACLRTAIADGDDHIEVELLNYRKDGSTFWNALGISPVYDSDGSLIYHFASQKDVSARRRAEELEKTEHRLLLEVDHRAMNALTLVQGIIGLTRADNYEGLKSAITSRVDALANAHRLLSDRRWCSVPLIDLIETELSNGIAEYVTVDGPCVSLAAHAVQPLALVVHELVSNARLHGALSTEAGSARLSWERCENDLLVRWHEEGPTLHEDKITERFGLTIARNVTERQLMGQLSITPNVGVLDAVLCLPCVV